MVAIPKYFSEDELVNATFQVFHFTRAFFKRQVNSKNNPIIFLYLSNSYFLSLCANYFNSGRVEFPTINSIQTELMQL